MKFRYIIVLNLILIYNSNAQTDIPFQYYDYSNKINYKKILRPSVSEKLNLYDYKKLLNLSEKKRDYKNSIKFLENIISLGENTILIKYKIASYSSIVAKETKSFVSVKYINKALKNYKSILSVDNFHLKSLIGLTKLYILLPSFLGGDIIEARENAKKIMKIDQVQANLIFGMINETENKKNDAKNNYKKAIKSFFNLSKNQNRVDKILLYELIDVSVRFKIIDSNTLLLVNAYNTYQEANLLELEWVYYRFSQIYLFLNNLKEANYYAKKSLDLNPKFEKAKEIINTIN
tara:strand:+ start:25498 stop:26370 length:873 start_codon:yes stop_codon:yes gene_type:complete